MKIINGIKHYTKLEVADLVGRSPQTLHLWHRWSDELEAQGKPRLIPAPIRWKSNYRLWSEEDIDKIKVFIDNLRKGDLKNFTNKKRKGDSEVTKVETNSIIADNTKLASSEAVPKSRRKKNLTVRVIRLNEPSEEALNNLHDLIIRMILEEDIQRKFNKCKEEK